MQIDYSQNSVVQNNYFSNTWEGDPSPDHGNITIHNWNGIGTEISSNQFYLYTNQGTNEASIYHGGGLVHNNDIKIRLYSCGDMTAICSQWCYCL